VLPDALGTGAVDVLAVGGAEDWTGGALDWTGAVEPVEPVE
jgi:hypothetical protein